MCIVLAGALHATTAPSRGQDTEAETANPRQADPTIVQADGAATQPAPKTARPRRLIDDPRAKRLWRIFAWSVILLIIFLFSVAAIVIFSRRFRHHWLRSVRKPTPHVDAWKMHKLPPDATADEGDDGDDFESGASDSPPTGS
jgi:hypothetical protein